MRAWGLPGPALRFLLVTVLFGTATIAIAAASLRPQTLGTIGIGWWAAVVGLCTWSQVRSFTLVWRERRLAIHPDEAVLMIAVLHLPPAEVVVAAAVSSIAGQVWLRKPPPKLVFNLAAQTAATGTGVVAFRLAAEAGAPLLIAAAILPFAVSFANQLLVALLLTLLRGEPTPLALRGGLLASVLVTGGCGTFLGLLTVALMALHPVALVVMPPAVWLGMQAMSASYRHQNEFTARARMNRAARDILAARSETEAIDLVLAACHEAFAAHEVSFVRKGGHAETRTYDEPPVRSSSLRASVFGNASEEEGELGVVVNKKTSGDLSRDQQILDLAASYLSLGLANVAALRSLERSERRLRDVLEGAPDPILILSRQGDAVFANAAATRTRAVERLDAASRSRLRSRDGAALELSSVDGCAWEAVVAPMQLEGGIDADLILMRDVTRRNELEEERRRYQQELEHAGRLAALGTLVAGVAHEVNNPLTYMTGGLDLALLDLAELEAETAPGPEKDLLQETMERLDNVRTGARRIATITKDLRVVARASGGDSSELVPVRPLLDDVRLLVEPMLRPRVTLRLKVSGSPVVVGSPTALHQVVLNLVKNAVEAIGEAEGAVELRLAEDDGQARIDVADNGPGMAPDVQQRLFTPFFTTKPQGTGLGLTTAHAIITGHGGSLQVASVPEEGATFTIRLPLAPEGAPAGARTFAGLHDAEAARTRPPPGG